MTAAFLFDQIQTRAYQPVELTKPVEVDELPTPALVLERSKLTQNLARMATQLAAHDKGFRPHTKTHKCPEIAKLQLGEGAVGVCVAKISEAVAMANAGIGPILVTSPLTSKDKLEVVDRLLKQGADLALVLDSRYGLDCLQESLTTATVLKVAIDLDVAMGRTGNRSNEEVLQIYEQVDQASNLSFLGFQHYAGHVMHIEGHAARAEASLALWSKIEERIDSLGVPFEMLSGGGTGTHDIDVGVGPVTDLQVGSYVFMDEEYRQIGSTSGERFEDFEVSLTIACRAISQPMPNAITLDGGYKSMASDTVPPVADELANTKFRFAGDEHGVLISKTAMQSVRLGDVVQLVTPHCDPTVNLHDYYWVQEEDGMIHSCWPITGRGCTW